MTSNPELIITGGDIAWNIDRVHKADSTIIEHESPGGSVYYCAVGAIRALSDKNINFSNRIGIFGQVGEDFNLDILHRLGIDISGVSVSSNKPTARFIVDQYSDNIRSFTAERGVGESIRTDQVPLVPYPLETPD